MAPPGKILIPLCGRSPYGSTWKNLDTSCGRSPYAPLPSTPAQKQNPDDLTHRGFKNQFLISC